MSLNKSKIISAGVINAGANKFVAGKSVKKSLIGGAVLSGSMVVSDSVLFQMVPVTVRSSLGRYAEDVTSSAVSSAFKTLMLDGKRAADTSSLKRFGYNFLIDFGSVLAGGYVAPMVHSATAL